MTTTNPTTEQASKIPVLLLKTRSSPGDSYEDLFSESNVNASGFAPQFVPVLLHQFHSDGMNEVAALLRDRRIGNQKHHEYGGLIFTSQRAVEAFVKLVEDGKADDIPKPEEKTSWPHLQNIPVYSVGPATTRALAAVPQEPPLQVFGSHTGNGAALAPFILAHYYEWYGGQKRATLPPILFLVGETRRDIIPKTLQDGALPDTERIRVTETVVYGTGVMESFPVDLRKVLGETRNDSMRWIVVFSPTGCDSMLRVMGILDPETNKVYKGYERDGKTFIATIGPTTRDHLLSFGFEPDVCAELPTPQGVLEGIQAFMAKRQS